MRRKWPFIVLVWFVAVAVVLIFYRARATSPVKEFVDWALGVWPILAGIFTVAVALSGWIIKSNVGVLTASKRKSFPSSKDAEVLPEHVTIEDLDQCYDAVRGIVEQKNRIADDVSGCSWKDYLPYYSERDHYKALLPRYGEKDAVLMELQISLSNPLLEARMKSDKVLEDLLDTYSRLVGKIGNTKLRNEIVALLRLQDEGQRNWISGEIVGTPDSMANSQIMKKRYADWIDHKQTDVLRIVNELRGGIKDGNRIS